MVRGKSELWGIPGTGKVPDPEKEIKKLVDKAKRGINSAADDARKGVRQAGKEVQDSFKKELPNILEKLIADLASEALKPALKAQAKLAHDFADGMDHVAKTAPALIPEINKVGFDVELKVNVELNLEYENFWTRAREVAGILDRYGNKGVKLRRRDIRGFITALGPDIIGFGGGASFSLGLDIGGVAKAKGISLPLFVELADYVMKEAGIPE